VHHLSHETDLGTYHLGDSAELLGANLGQELRGKVQLILTSPPFPLNRKKSYGNFAGQEYKEWLVSNTSRFPVSGSAW
jgi:site-specific DNA-methyltransferase (cytosine-N4-specific)